MNKQSRYRTEGSVVCVDVRVSSIEHLFDNRDPAPFRQRDLDPALVEYLLDASEDLAGQGPFRLVFWLETASRSGEIEAALRAHFTDLDERLQRQRRRHRRTGQVALLLGIVLVAALIWLAHWIPEVVPGALGLVLREGLVIFCWIVLWRPVEILIYEWIPVRHERRLAARLREAPIDVRLGKGPDASAAAPKMEAVEGG